MKKFAWTGITLWAMIICIPGFHACRKDHEVGRHEGANFSHIHVPSNPFPTPGGDPFLIHDGHVGKIHAGMRLADARALFGKNNVRISDSPYPEYWDMFWNAAFFYLPGEKAPIFSAGLNELPWEQRDQDIDLRDETLGPIVVEDGRFHTAEGVGVRSTLGEIRKAYPDLKVVLQRRFWAIYSERAGLRFNRVDRVTRPDEGSGIESIEVNIPRRADDWSIYANKKYGISFRFPRGLVVREEGSREIDPLTQGLHIKILDRDDPAVLVLNLDIEERLNGTAWPWFDGAGCHMYKDVYFSGFLVEICVGGGSASCEWEVRHIEKDLEFTWRTGIRGEDARSGPRDWTYPILAILQGASYGYHP